MKKNILKAVGGICLGFFIVLVLIEITLNLTGYVYRNIHDYSLPQPDDDKLRILCIGESTTAPAYTDTGFDISYPRFLQQFLNRRIPVQVINGGIINTDSYFALKKRLQFFKKYQPDIVVFMLGINDHGETIKYYPGKSTPTKAYFTNLKIYKLYRVLKQNMEARELEDLSYVENFEYTYENEYESFYSADDGQASSFEFINEFSSSPDYKLKIKPLDLVKKYFSPEIVENIEKAVELAKQEKLFKAKDYLLKGFSKSPYFTHKNDKTLDFIVDHDAAESIAELKKLIKEKPEHDLFYFLATYALLDDNAKLCVHLLQQAYLHRDPKYKDANLDFNKLFEKRARDKDFTHYAKLMKQGKIEIAKKLLGDQLATHSSTIHNYRLFAEKALESGVTVIAMQYPRLPVRPLKKILKPFESKIHFISNEENFKEVNPDNYSEYFFDSFAGVFGHCWAKGNRIIANNLGSYILKLRKAQAEKNSH